ncbi:hypothetical protein MMC06_000799 [Schaereria dolodes]|nr:hypothetical protein [Schaereria dolodes]
MSSRDPNPLLWTLRFKQHKTTILLFVEQAQSFISIKQELLEAIRKSGRTEVNGRSLPADPEDVIFGLPKEKNDYREWVGIDIPNVEIEDDMGSKKKVGGKKSVLNASPLGAGLKDGAILAFKFKQEDSRMDEDGLDMDDSNWDVVMPSYEDEIGS